MQPADFARRVPHNIYASREGLRPDVSVVIPTLNSLPYLLEQLRSLQKQDFEGRVEIIVSDNGSTDGTQNAVRRLIETDGWIVLVDASDAPGANHARNVGIGAAGADLILLCDSDDVVSNKWVAAMWAASGNADLLGGPVEFELLNPGRPAWWSSLPEQTDNRVGLGFLPYALAGNCALKREVFESLGGFDATHTEGTNDAELSWRAQLAGSRLAFVPDALVHYRDRATLTEAFVQHVNRGIGQVRLYRRFRSVGVKRPRIWSSVAQWAWLLVTAPFAFAIPRHRHLWVRRMALRIGRARGSLRFRVFYL